MLGLGNNLISGAPLQQALVATVTGIPKTGSEGTRVAAGFDNFSIYAVDVHGNASAARIMIQDFSIHRSPDASGDEHPDVELVDKTTNTDYVVTEGYSYSGYPGEEMFGNVGDTSDTWWTLGNSTAANSWVNLEITAGVIVPASFQVMYVPLYCPVGGFKIFGNTGAKADTSSPLLAWYNSTDTLTALSGTGIANVTVVIN